MAPPKGSIPWNKGKIGLQKHSKETRQKMSIAHTGERNHQYGKRGEFSPNYGKKCSEETKDKISTALRGREFTNEWRHNLSNSLKGREVWNKDLKGVQTSPNKGKTFSLEWKAKLSAYRKGVYCKSNHPRWKNGASYEPYCEKFDEDLKNRVRANTKYTCILCGKSQEENGRSLPVHHNYVDKMACCESRIQEMESVRERIYQIHPEIVRFGEPVFSNAEIEKIRQLVPLCDSCHGKSHGKSNEIKYRIKIDNIIEQQYKGKCWITVEETHQ